MKTSKRFFLSFSYALSMFLLFPAIGNGQTETKKKIDVEIGINREHRDVGLKRMELLDKMLSPELLEKKRIYVQKLEQDYNNKIMQLINSIIPPAAQNKVLTHIDVNFFSPEFESEVYVTRKVGVSIILRQGAIKKWSEQHKSEREALAVIKGLVNTTFNIPAENISVTIIR